MRICVFDLKLIMLGIASLGTSIKARDTGSSTSDDKDSSCRLENHSANSRPFAFPAYS
jgi:hypothetical protein